MGQFNKAFSITLMDGQLNGKHFHGSKTAPTVPSLISSNILCVLGLSTYTNFTSQSIKKINPQSGTAPQMDPAPSGLMPSDLETQYDANPLYKQGSGKGQTIGIVTLADFNPSDAYYYWNYNHITVNPNRIQKINVDGGSVLSVANGSDESTLDVEQSGALAPGANINVYVAPNTDTGFVDGFARAISDNQVQELSTSWGESEPVIQYFVNQDMETPQYAQSFNQLFMEAAAQGISTFAAAGDAGAYSATRDLGSLQSSPSLPGTFDPAVLNPTDSPYITAAGGTTLPISIPAEFGVTQERAWGWDYLYPLFENQGITPPYFYYFSGGGGGFSQYFATPDYQQGVSGVNQYSAVEYFTPNADGSNTTFNPTPSVVTGNGSGRNMPDLSMNADPESGYSVYYNLPDGSTSAQDDGWETYGGTSFVAPQLAGLTALINSVDHTQVGFWNPQIYHFVEQSNSPFHTLNQTGTSNDNAYYTGTAGTIYNQATGLGTPDIAALAQDFANESN